MWKNLDDFSKWYIENNHPLKPPAYEPIYDTGYSLRYVVFRENRYQAEICIVKPNSVFNDVNKNKLEVDNCTVFLSGEFIGYKNNDIVFNTQNLGRNTDGTSIFLNRIFKQSQFDLDKLITTDQGAAFISLQYWTTGIKMNSLAKFNSCTK